MAREKMLKSVRDAAIDHDDEELALLLLHLEREDEAVLEVSVVKHLDAVRRLAELTQKLTVTILKDPSASPDIALNDVVMVRGVVTACHRVVRELERLTRNTPMESTAKA